MLIKGLLTIAVMSGLAVAPLTPVPSSPGGGANERLQAIPELAWHATNEAGGKCSVTCWDHIGTGVHAAPAGGDANEIGAGSHTNTYPDSCDNKHPFCGGESFAFTGSLNSAIARKDVDAIRRLLDDTTREVVVVIERSAVQLVGCRGEVIAHVKLPADLLNTLADAALVSTLSTAPRERGWILGQ